jgi:predicted transcriptional regulator
MAKDQRSRRTAAHTHYVRLTDEEDAALRTLADRERRPLSHMTRECIRREAVRQGVWPEEQEQEPAQCA